MPREGFQWYKRTVGKHRKTETDLKTPSTGYADWQYALVHYLADHGVRGLTQAELQRKFAHWATAEVMKHELECLRLQGRVQLFRVPRANGTTNLWRATDKILED